jgi:hypothetical protein
MFSRGYWHNFRFFFVVFLIAPEYIMMALSGSPSLRCTPEDDLRGRIYHLYQEWRSTTQE